LTQRLHKDLFKDLDLSKSACFFWSIEGSSVLSTFSAPEVPEIHASRTLEQLVFPVRLGVRR